MTLSLTLLLKVVVMVSVVHIVSVRADESDRVRRLPGQCGDLHGRCCLVDAAYATLLLACNASASALYSYACAYDSVVSLCDRKLQSPAP